MVEAILDAVKRINDRAKAEGAISDIAICAELFFVPKEDRQTALQLMKVLNMWWNDNREQRIIEGWEKLDKAERNNE